MSFYFTLALTPAPQGFLGHLIAREYSQEECRDGEARSGFGGGGGSPEGDRSGRRCLRHSLLIRQPICVRAATRTMTARLG